MIKTIEPPALGNRLKMSQIRLLAAIGETLNLRQAAARLNMTQPGASRLILELEEALGIELFERSRKGMTPTQCGNAMIGHSRVILANIDQAGRELNALAQGLSGTVRIGTLVSAAPFLVPRSIARLQRPDQAFTVTVHEGTHELLVTALKRGELDLVIGRIVSSRVNEDLNFDMLYQERFCVVCGPHHNLAMQTKTDLAALVSASWVLPPMSVPLRQRLEALFMAQADRSPKAFIESVSILTNLTLLQETDLLGIMSSSVAYHYAALNLIRILPVALDDLLGTIAVITAPAFPRSALTDGFIRTIKEVAREHAALNDT